MTGVLATAAERNPEFYLDVVVRSGLDVSIADAITGGDIERTMDGASTLSLTLHDPHRALLRNPDLARAIDMEFNGYWWRLVKVAKSGDDLTLTFEDRDVAYLRSHTKPRAMKRGKVTRAQFIKTLVREVGQRPPKGQKKGTKPRQKPIVFVCPELRKKQPVGKVPSKRTPGERDENREPGISARAKLKVKGAPAKPEQLRNGKRVLDIADQLGAGPKATKALMEAVIIESQIRNLSYGDRDSIGILQVRVGQHGRAVASSIEKSVHRFLTKGWTGAGGAMDLAKKNSSWSAGRVAQEVQGSGRPDAYDTVADEADAWIEAYGGVSGTDTGGSSRTASSRSKKKYQFRRGEPGKPENSWTAIQRLAEEVKWHAFMDKGRLYYVSDDWLRRQKARYVIDEDDDGVHEINFDIDQGKVSSEISVIARAAMFQIPIGCMVRVRECGIANGRYVVRRVRQSIFDNACEISLSAPTPKLPEPAAESTGGGPGKTTATVSSKGSRREKIVEVAEASAANYRKNPGAWFYSKTGAWNTADPTKPPTRGNRSDCSQWVAAVYKKAGAPSPGPSGNIWTGNMRVKGKEVPLKDAKPGDIILYGPAPSHHVELCVGGTKTIGHGSTPVDPGTVSMMADPHCWRYDFLDD